MRLHFNAFIPLFVLHLGLIVIAHVAHSPLPKLVEFCFKKASSTYTYVEDYPQFCSQPSKQRCSEKYIAFARNFAQFLSQLRGTNQTRGRTAAQCEPGPYARKSR